MRISVAGIGSYDPDKVYDFDEVETEIESIVRPGLRLVDAWRGTDARRPVVIDEVEAVTTVRAIGELARHPDVYQRGSTLVRVLTPSDGSPEIIAAHPSWVRDCLSEVCDFRGIVGRKKELGSVPIPKPLSQTIVERRVYQGVRVLTDLVETPTLRPDGTVLDAPGYDASTGLLYMPRRDYARVVADPSLEAAQAAAARLLEPLREFPMKAAADRSVALAAILSIVGRHAIDGAVPMFAVRATAAGTGKSLLARCFGLIATGRQPLTVSPSADENEAKREITMLLRCQPRAVTLDNIKGDFGSPSWAATITAQGEVKGRTMGSSDGVSGVWRSIVLGTGNNLGFVDDLARRVLVCDLVSPVEDPENRTFDDSDLAATIERQHPELCVDALTVLRAFAAAGRPEHGRSAMGSFEAWDRLVRGALVWLGMADPCDVRERLISGGGDRDKDALGALLGEIRRVPRIHTDGAWACHEILAAAETDPALREAISAVAKLDGRSFGQYIAGKAGTICQGLKFEEATGRAGVKRWCIVGGAS